MNKISSKIMKGMIIIFLLAVWSSCRTREENLGIEPVKSIKGTWEISKVVRNGEDITSRVDVSDFQITFEEDSTGGGKDTGHYKIINGAPFVVTHDGTWSLDDPVYPFYLSLYSSSDPEVKITPFLFSTVKGESQIKLVFSPGCLSNSYQYLLKKIND